MKCEFTESSELSLIPETYKDELFIHKSITQGLRVRDVRAIVSNGPPFELGTLPKAVLQVFVTTMQGTSR